jgi:nucleoside-diphosphate-sugar epimerase
VLVRDWDPQSELVRTGDILRTSVVNGRLEDFDTLERAINEHEIDTVFHLAAQPIVTTAFRNPLPTFEANIRGSYNLLEACRVHRSARDVGCRRVQRQGLRRRADAAVHRGHAGERPSSVRRQQEAARICWR